MWADWPQLNVQLRESIPQHARRHAGKQRTNVGGWSSETGLLQFCGRAGETLIRHMYEMTEEATLRLYAEFAQPPQQLSWMLSAWANINQRDDFNNMHTHPGVTWSGVYYADAGESDPAAESTAIVLADPCAAPHRGVRSRAFKLKSFGQARTGFDDTFRAMCRMRSRRTAAIFRGFQSLSTCARNRSPEVSDQLKATTT